MFSLNQTNRELPLLLIPVQGTWKVQASPIDERARERRFCAQCVTKVGDVC